MQAKKNEYVIVVAQVQQLELYQNALLTLSLTGSADGFGDGGDFFDGGGSSAGGFGNGGDVFGDEGSTAGGFGDGGEF